MGAASPEEIAGKTGFDFYARKLAERYRADEQEIVRSGQPLFDKKEPGVDEEGNERLLSTTKLPLRDDSGKIVGLVGITREVGEREEAFEESEERYRRLVESSPKAIAILSEERNIVFIKAAGARIAGTDDPEELIGRPYLDFIHPDFRETARSRVLQSQEGKTAQLLQEKLLRLDGSPVEVEVVTIPTTYEGRPAAQSIIKDITEPRRRRRSSARARSGSAPWSKTPRTSSLPWMQKA